MQIIELFINYDYKKVAFATFFIAMYMSRLVENRY
jgi:hypothetical protein